MVGVGGTCIIPAIVDDPDSLVEVGGKHYFPDEILIGDEDGLTNPAIIASQVECHSFEIPRELVSVN